MTPDEGFVSHAVARDLRGEMGMTTIPLRPGGKVAVEGAVYEAASIDGTFVDRGARVVVKRCEGGVLYVEPVENDTV